MKNNDEKRNVGTIIPPRKKQTEIRIAGADSFQCVTSVSRIGYAKMTSHRICFPDPITNKSVCMTLKDPRPDNDVQALLVAAQFDKQLVEGIDPRRASKTIAELFYGPFLDHIRNKKKSCHDDVSRFECHVQEKIGHLRPDQVTSASLQRLCDQLTSTKRKAGELKEGTKNRVKALLKTFFKTLQLWGYSSTNPAQHLRLYRERNRRTRILQDGEMRAFFQALDDSPLQFQLFVRFLLHTATRLNEALTCRWSSVSIGQATLWLEDTKSGEPRSIPLSTDAMAVIHELAKLRVNDYLFPGKSGGGHMARPGRQFRKLIGKAGTAGLWLHDFRRSASSLACRNGASIHDVSKLLGHSNVRVTERYVVTHSPRVAAAVQGIGDLIKDIVDQVE